MLTNLTTRQKGESPRNTQFLKLTQKEKDNLNRPTTKILNWQPKHYPE